MNATDHTECWRCCAKITACHRKSHSCSINMLYIINRQAKKTITDMFTNSCWRTQGNSDDQAMMPLYIYIYKLCETFYHQKTESIHCMCVCVCTCVSIWKGTLNLYNESQNPNTKKTQIEHLQEHCDNEACNSQSNYSDLGDISICFGYALQSFTWLSLYYGLTTGW